MPDPSTIRAVECSPPCWMVRLALEEKGLDHECKLLSFTAGEHKSPEMLAKNPRGTVPVLMDGNIVVYETLAIFDYLEYAYPQPALYPRDPAERARCRLLDLFADELMLLPIRLLMHRNTPGERDPARWASSEARAPGVTSRCRNWGIVSKTTRSAIGSGLPAAPPGARVQEGEKGQAARFKAQSE